MNSYPNINAFYDDNPLRRRSGESDYGVWWRKWGDLGHWRVSYIRATGEVYAVERPEGPVEILGTVPPDEEGLYYRTLNKVLDGWALSENWYLSWVRDRLSAAGYGRAGPEAPPASYKSLTIDR